MMRDIPVSPHVFLQGIIDHWDVDSAHSFILQLAQEWGYESFTTELATKLFQQAGYEVEVTEVEEDEGEDFDDDDGWIPWSGGERPVSENTFVKYRLFNGLEEIDRAGLLRWEHLCFEGTGYSSNIIAYKVVD